MFFTNFSKLRYLVQKANISLIINLKIINERDIFYIYQYIKIKKKIKIEIIFKIQLMLHK
jgi:hypothetical protein